MTEGDDHTTEGRNARLTRRQFIKRAVLATTAVVAVDSMLIEPNWIAFLSQDVQISGLPEAFDGYRIAVLSDFHIPHCIGKGFVQKACDTAMSFRPNLIVLPGDFVHSWDFVFGHRSGVPSLAGYFDSLSASDGVFGVLGNHDHWLDGDGVRRELADHTPIELLEGRHRFVEREGERIALVGLDDLWQQGLDLTGPFTGIPDHTPRILLQHNPDLAEEMPDGCRVDLQLSGHTHGGHIRVPFGPALIIPSRYGNKFREGLVQGKRHRVYVTRGVGTATPVQARLWARPDVSGIVLRCAG